MSTLIVTGITRSGLSLTMQMLHAGGYPCAGTFPAFEDFPIGHIPWGEVDGKAVKLVDAQLQLPPAGDYTVVRLHRDLKDQAKSINKWNNHFGLPSAPVSRYIGSLRRDYAVIDEWANKQRQVHHLEFADLVTKPLESALQLTMWTGADLDIPSMVAAVIPRTPEVHQELLELRLVGDETR